MQTLAVCQARLLQTPPTYIFVLQVLEVSEFPVRSLGVHGCLEGSGQLLERHSGAEL